MWKAVFLGISKNSAPIWVAGAKLIELRKCALYAGRRHRKTNPIRRLTVAQKERKKRMNDLWRNNNRDRVNLLRRKLYKKNPPIITEERREKNKQRAREYIRIKEVRERRRQYNLLYRKNNPAFTKRRAKRVREYRKLNSAKLAAQRKEYWLKNRATLIAARAKWYAHNAEREREKAAIQSKTLSDSYIRNVFFQETPRRGRKIPEVLIDAIRLRLKIKRFLQAAA